jgi:Leucine-rich repeat (LRR) protein
MFPNLESFSIQMSNLLRSDLPNFDFCLWPNLKSLNFEKNHALELTNYQWPKSLETFRVVNCGLNVLPDLPNLKDFSWTVAPEWLSFFLPVITKKFPHLERLYLSMNTYAHDKHIEYFVCLSLLKKLTLIEITFKELLGFTVQRFLNKIRNLCPNILIKSVYI